MNYKNPIGYMQSIGKTYDDDCTAKLIGYALAKLIMGTDTVDTEIGKIVDGDKDGKYLRIVGALYDGSSSTVRVMRTADSVIKREFRFNQFKGKSALELAKEFMDDSGLQFMGEVESGLSKLYNSLMFFYPIAVNDRCILKRHEEIRAGNSKIDKVVKVESNIDTVSICADSTGVIKYNMTIAEKDRGSVVRTNKVNLTDYGNTLLISNIDGTFKGRGINRDLIKFTNYGYIMPVEIVYGNGSLLIDNSVAYRVIQDYIMPVAYWSGDKLVGEPLDKMVKEPDNKHLKDLLRSSLGYICQHKRYIAPAFITEPNIVDIRK